MPVLIGGFFFGAWAAMVFWSAMAEDFGLPTISYVRAMVLTAGLWVVLLPLVVAVRRADRTGPDGWRRGGSNWRMPGWRMRGRDRDDA